MTAAVAGASLTSPVIAPYLWDVLRRAFPAALAALLMPDHPHLIVNEIDEPSARRRMAAALSGVTRHFARPPLGLSLQWRLAMPRPPIAGRHHLEREIRYVALNPCRARLVSDPLEWCWTSHRDVVGAVADPWVTAGRLATALGRPLAGFVREHHAYVSADPAVRTEGTPAPRPAVAASPTPFGLARLCAAAAAATRASPQALRQRSAARSLLIQLAVRHGWYRPGVLARLCDLTRQSVHRLSVAPVDRRALAAADVCLGDDRLVRRVLDDLDVLRRPVGADDPVPRVPSGTARTPGCGRR